MDFQSFRLKSSQTPLIRFNDVLKWFPQANEATIKQNLKYWVKKGLLERLCRGIYKLPETEITDEFAIASFLDTQSFISLESALSFYGMIPEYPYAVTSVTMQKTQSIKTNNGRFIFRKIKKELFFGFTQRQNGHFFYRIAEPEKAFFDFLYLNERDIKSSDYWREMRLSLAAGFSMDKLRSYYHFLRSSKSQETIEKYACHQ